MAHPDDEAMFFGPTIRYLTKTRNKIYILCMTNGDFYGKGGLRSKEMKASCQTLVGHGPSSNLVNVKIVNEPQLPDHPEIRWDENLGNRIIKTYLEDKNIDTLITFDRHGVSSHANHCALYHLALNLHVTNLDIFTLESVNLVRKYTSLLDLLPSFLVSQKNSLAVNSLTDFWITFSSMMKHKSQLTWFRWIYLFTSRYMLINNLNKL